MRAYDIIRKKRDGEALAKEEIAFLINGHLKGEVPDYQISAFLMAVCLKGMDHEETVSLTGAMLRSGATLDLKGISGTKLDKHSTGGVGDKTSIILAPLMASMGIKVPMVSGRGLGHTGGTLDKLESIPGLRTDLTAKEFRENLKNPGFSIMGQTEELAPADKKLYALRDVTATVESIPLIAASIMSKKLAEGAEGLVLDVKVGSGAFMKKLKDARELAHTMVSIGNSMGVRTVAVITAMDEPLGKTVGNSLEIKECLSALHGAWADDLKTVTMTLAAWMLNMADSLTEETPLKGLSNQTKRKYIDEAMDFIEKGDAFKKFVEFVDAQHGDPETAFKPAQLPSAKDTKHVLSKSEGYIRRLDAMAVGTASMLLGAGRKRAGDAIDPAAGIILTRKTGDYVKAGEPLAMFHYGEGAQLDEAEEAFYSGVETGPKEPRKKRLVHEVVMPPKE
jgi:pyrimidine-nucleoside phosphorylase